ncbi:MAG: hypothetical protein K0S34_391 [Bacillales bacterium]|jgi:hypothetical protein|nr:hypothetical protein [Bacillales bacterium]
MKRIALFLVVLTMGLSLVACGLDNKTTNSNIDEVDKEKKPTGVQYYNEAFKEVVADISDNEVVIKGKARVFEGVFQYALLTSDDEVLLTDHYQTEGAPAWGEFEIVLEKEMTTNADVVFELFVYSAKDGSKINSLKIPIGE